MNRIYLDNAATTRLDEKVYQAMTPYLLNNFGNASSIYKEGREARAAVDNARRQVASAIGAQPSEIFFTSGGSESDNWAIKNIAYNRSDKGKHIITSKIEHHAVLHTLDQLKKEGFEITALDVDDKGLISVEQLKNAIRPDTILITIMYANNEIGTIQPVAEIGAIAREKGIIFHTDAVQAIGHIPVNVVAEKIDMLSISAHKFNGPKGVGALFSRKGVRLTPQVFGGEQESGRRAGTENTAGIVGLGEAIKIATDELKENNSKIIGLRDKLIEGVLKIPYTRLNGGIERRLPNNANFSIQFIEGESLILSLDMVGVSASSGSACTTGSLDPSHVLLAIGLPHEIAHGSLRFSLDKYTTESDIDFVLEKLPPIVDRLRAMSPLWDKR